MFINSRRDTAILVRGLGRTTIEDNSVSVGSLRTLSVHATRVGAVINIDVDRPWYRGQMFACVVEVIPRRSIIHAPY